LRQVTASVIGNEKVLGELERTHARTISGSWLMWLRCPEIARDARPGQFVMVGCGEECILPRPFSIHRVSGNGDIAIFFAVWEDGTGTKWLAQRKANDEVGVIGPLGNGFSILPKAQNLLLVAGGIGLAPLLFLTDQALKDRHTVKLLRGASGAFKPSGKPNPPQHYPEELLPQGIDLETTSTSPEGARSPDGRHGLALDLITPEAIKWADQVFACGPTAMYREMANMRQLKQKPVQVSLEARMGCGQGVCYSCTVRTKKGLKQVCRDGPVFTLDEIIWDELSPKL
jgi:dihydroorotate dehydrogenase electron transfer subunit